MRNDRVNLCQADFVEGLVQSGRNREIVELDEQVVFLVDAKRVRILAQGHHILVVDVKIATAGQRQPPGELIAQLLKLSPHASVVKNMLGTGMWGGYDVRDTVGNGILGHGQGIFYGFGSVIQPRQDVRVKIDHVASSMRHPRHAEKTCHTPRSSMRAAKT